MADPASTLDAIMAWVEEARRAAEAHPELARLLYSGVIVLVSYLGLRLYRGILRRLSGARAVEPGVVERLYRFTSLAVWTIVLSIVVYVLTGATAAWASAILIVFVILLANIDNLVNFFSYYVLLAERLVRPGDYVEVPGYGGGLVREIRYLHTVVEQATGVRLIPNRELLRRGFRVVDEVVPARIIVRVSGIGSPDEVERVRRRIESVAELRGGEVAAITHPLHGGPGTARAFVSSVASDHAEYIVEIPVPRPSAGPRRLGVLVYPIAAALQEMGYSYEIRIQPA